MTVRMTPAMEEQLGEAAGRIAVYAAKSLCEEFPHLDLDQLVDTFTRPSAARMIASRFLDGIDRGLTPGQSAGETGAALIHVWADSRLEARALLDQAKAGPVRNL